MRLTAILISLVAGIMILALKIYAAHIANSTALRSDALEGVVNVLAAAFGLCSILFAEKPADKEHPYGHGKIEYFASAFEGGLITLAGSLILLDAVTRILSPDPIAELNFGLKLNLLAGLANGMLGAFIYRAGKRYHSTTLVADGIHLLSDLVSTLVLGLGLVLVLFTGWEWLDPTLALGVALFLFKTGYSLVIKSSHALLDGENPDLLNRIVTHLNEIDRETQNRAVITVHELRAQQFGRDQHVDIHVVVPEFLSIQEAHLATDSVTRSLKNALGEGSQIHTHVDPCERKYCSECSYEPCPIRASIYIKRKPISLDSATSMGEI